MGLSSKGIQDAANARVPQGWVTCRLDKAKHIVTKDGVDKIVLNWHHPDSGAEVGQFLNVTMPGNGTVSRKDLLMLNKINELNGIEFEDGTTEEALAEMIQNNVSAMDLLIAYSGDGTFINDVAPPGSHGAEGPTEPSAVQVATPVATAKKRASY